ncbi:flagellar basal body-associated FliL family protein [Pedobacter hartonius]|uniref:Uncharacterized protein n=1 Tax=Pedobacter hartonius TaxID=425514 RepID=A0A1H4GPM6_9SPHI|nr:hypothetical protein [Pedobacter hartonius]SEB10572.1 hypothetical protein SAMN05443550_110187 [Pedobacter hartonius]
MKKLFFFAAVALVAVGGAANAKLYLVGSDQAIPCDLPISPSCAQVTGLPPSYPVSSVPATKGSTQPNDRGVLAEYSYTGI